MLVCLARFFSSSVTAANGMTLGSSCSPVRLQLLHFTETLINYQDVDIVLRNYESRSSVFRDAESNSISEKKNGRNVSKLTRIGKVAKPQPASS